MEDKVLKQFIEDVNKSENLTEEMVKFVNRDFLYLLKIHRALKYDQTTNQ